MLTVARAAPIAAAHEAVGAMDAEERWLNDGGRVGAQSGRDHQPARTTRVVSRAWAIRDGRSRRTEA